MEFSHVSYKRSNRKVLKSADGYLYSNASKSRHSNVRYVRCVLRDCHATGKVKSDPDEFVPVKEHNHEPKKYKLEQHQLEVALRQKAASPTHSKETLNKIFREVTRDHDLGSNISFSYLESGMLKARRKVHPRTPDSIEELVQCLEDNPVYGLNFKCHVTDGNQDALIFISEAATQRLVGISSINFDGTFFVVPEPFHQFWSILGEFEGKLFPLIGVLMTGRTTSLYETVLAKIKELIPTFLPDSAMGDFEVAARNALRGAFDGIRLTGCRFHLAQNLFRKLGKLGLKVTYSSDPLFKKWARAHMALPFLPARGIAPAHDILKQQIASFDASLQDKMQQFSRYFKKVYLTQYSAEEISVYRLPRATNNEQEAYHWQLKSIFLAKPNTWIFIKRLNNNYRDASKDMVRAEQGLRLGRPRKLKDVRNQKRRLELFDELDCGRRTPLPFLYAISFTLHEEIESVQVEEEDDSLSEGEDNIDPLLPDNGPADGQGNALECVVCTGERIAPHHIFVPCGHGRSCRGCMDIIMQRRDHCPECRSPIQGLVHAIIY
jgi:hypothetical protein